MNPVQQILKAVCVLLIVSVCPSLYGATAADRSTWQYRKTDLHMTGRGRIRGIRYPRGKGPVLLREKRQRLADICKVGIRQCYQFAAHRRFRAVDCCRHEQQEIAG